MEETLIVSVLGLLSAYISSQAVAPVRRCAFLASPRNSVKAQQAGNVSGAIQQCAQTECCMGIFRLENGQSRPDLLGCSIVETSCPELSCHASIYQENYIRCVCNSDFCNFNITLNHQDQQSHDQHSHASGQLIISIIVISAGSLIILFLTITAVKWKHFQKDCSPVTHLITVESDTDLVNMELEKVVACGHSACVWQGYFKGLSVALKVFPATQRQEFIKEKDVYMLPFMMHPGIAQFLVAGRMEQDFVVVLELATQGSLNAFLSRTECNWLSTVKLVQTLSQGLAYLHTELNKNGMYKPAIAHCDLSSSNVLVKADGSCALCDFGCSMILEGFENSQALVENSGEREGRIQRGTLNYMSPEILEGCVNLSSTHCLLQGDVYSLGLVLWEVLMRCADLFRDSTIPAHMLPYEADLGLSPSLEDLLAFVSEQRVRPSIPTQWCQVFKGFSLNELLEDCWDHDADARLTSQCAANRLALLPLD